MTIAISPSQLWKKRLGDWVLNPYIGCEHGCYHCYCPAMPGVRFSNRGHTQREWGKYLFPKPNLVASLREQLCSFTPERAKRTEWGDGWILMSFLTDCYTPAEAKHRLTRQCLELLLAAGHKVRVQTRSALAERDFDLFAAHPGRVLFGTSIPHLDDPLSRVLEPRATAPTRRLKMLERAANAGIPVYVAIAPFLPFHTHDNLEGVLSKIVLLRPREVFCEVLNPKGENLAMMIDALAPRFPHYAACLSEYSIDYWSKFTWRVLRHGLSRSRRFIPWPDTQRHWRAHLSQDRVTFLDRFLPPDEVAA
jgi:DNA repair photolyase